MGLIPDGLRIDAIALEQGYQLPLLHMILAFQIGDPVVDLGFGHVDLEPRRLLQFEPLVDQTTKHFARQLLTVLGGIRQIRREQAKAHPGVEVVNGDRLLIDRRGDPLGPLRRQIVGWAGEAGTTVAAPNRRPIRQNGRTGS